MPIRTISLILGEGGSGGALAIQVTDVRGQMEDALYATAPPESMAAIVFRDPERIEDALAILKPGAKDLKNLNVIDRIVPAPEDVTDTTAMCQNIDQFLSKGHQRICRDPKLKNSSSDGKSGPRTTAFQREAENFMILSGISKRPLKRLFENRRRISKSSTIRASQKWARVTATFSTHPTNHELIECGAGKQGDKRRKGCGKLIPLRGTAG
jgi:hypothetical protein